MSTTIGYVILERNQASGQLGIGLTEIYERGEAEEIKGDLERGARIIGRRETYLIASVEVDDR
jgi:hypothetical protein